MAGTIAYHMMSYYNANTSSSDLHVGELPEPYFWWQAGALWGVALDYFYYTGDASYNDALTAALTDPSNTGSDFDYVPEEHSVGMANDDIFHWAAAALSAAERNFPQPEDDVPSWLEMSRNAFDRLTDEWSDKTCSGGLPWVRRNGPSYKNTATNGGLFQLAARLSRATDDDGGKYVEWAEKAWDWTADVGFLTKDYDIYDGAHGDNDCKDVNKLQWSYINGIYLYGAAVMANYTGEEKWIERAEGLLSATEIFFSEKNDDVDADDDAEEAEEGILWEVACERIETCTVDMMAFKGILARYMWQSTHMIPSMRDTVRSRLTPSAEMAALTCTGGDLGECGFAWYTGENDGKLGLGSEMSALETIQGLLIGEMNPPLSAKEIKRVGSDGSSGQGSGDKDEDGDGAEQEAENEDSAGGALAVSWQGAILASGVSCLAMLFA